MQKAFLYQERYFVLPDECNDVSEMLALYTNIPMEVWECVEKKCMAPYFVQEFMVLSTITLGDGDVYPCDVEIMSMLEYNRRLRRLVLSNCGGCALYGALTSSDSSLQGHHEERTLDNLCFKRIDADNPDLSRAADWVNDFVESFPTLGLERMIDDGKMDDAVMTFADSFAHKAFYPPVPLILGKAGDGRYSCYMFGMFESTNSLLNEYVMDELDCKYKEKWDFQNYIPFGTHFDDAVKPLGIAFEVVRGERNYIDAVIYCGDASPMSSYLYLCETIGEDRMHNACGSFRSESGKSTDMQSVEEFADAVSECLQDLDAKDIMLPPNRALALFGDGEGEPPTKIINYRSDRLMFDFASKLADGKTPANVWEDENYFALYEMPLARLRLKMTTDPFTGENPDDFEHYLDEMDDIGMFLADSMCCKSFGQEYDRDEFVIDLIVLSLSELMYRLRYLTPKLKTFDAVLEIYSKGGKFDGKYRVGYDMKRL